MSDTVGILLAWISEYGWVSDSDIYKILLQLLKLNTTLDEHQVLVWAIRAPLMAFHACESNAIEYLQEIASKFKW